MHGITGSIGEGPPRVSIETGIPDAVNRAADAGDVRHSFLRSAWYMADGGEAPRTIVGERVNGEVICAIPTVATGRGPLRLRAVPGSYWPYRSFPIACDAGDAELASILGHASARRALGPVWRLGPIYAEDPTLDRLLRVAPIAGWTPVQRRVGTTFVFDMQKARKAGPWPRSSTLKSNRRYEKQLAAEGELTWRFVFGDGWTSAVFDDLALIEQRSWLGKDEGADPKFMDPRRRRMWEAVVQDPALARMVRAGILYVAGAPAAFNFAVCAGQVRYCLATSYDERFARMSPGTVVNYRAFVEAAERGITLLDRGVGDGGHKSNMGAEAGAEVVDFLFVRNRALAALLRPLWRRSGNGQA